MKLKQTWIWGLGTSHKRTVFKMKHKDAKFPIPQGIYSADIPILVPSIDLQPTVVNAALLRVTYQITVIGTVRGTILPFFCFI